MNKDQKSSNKCPICGRLTHRESKYCIFHASAEEKTEEKFKKALKEYIDKIKEENDNYDFRKFIFVGDIDFKKDLNITIFKNADFHKATFEGDIGFEGATFKGKARFRWTKFEGFNHFRNATFEEDTDFRSKNFFIILNIYQIKTLPGKKLFIRLNNEEGEISFERAYLVQIKL